MSIAVYSYLAHGLSFLSNQALPNLVQQPNREQYAFTINFAVSKQSINLNTTWLTLQTEVYKEAQPNLVIQASSDKNWYRWNYADGTQFLIGADGRKVLVNWPETESFENTLSYFFGAIFRFLLNLHGHVSLHASIVLINSHTALFVGDSGKGKSTLAAAFSQLAYPILSDDLAALRLDEQGRLWVERGFSLIKLWPDSMALIGTADLPRLIPHSPYWSDFDKRQMEADIPAPETALVGAIYFLQERNASAEAKFETLAGQSRLVQLLANTYKSLSLPESASSEFEFFSRIANQLSFANLSLPDNGNWREYCPKIVDDFKKRL